MDQLAVSDTVLPSGGADALNPQAAVLTLFDTAIAERIAIGAIGSFLRGLVQLALGEEKTFGPLEILLAPCTALGTAFYASHGFCSFCRFQFVSEESRAEARRYKDEELGGSIFLETRRVAAKRKDGFAQRVCSGVAM
jgi:hypothetical protein